MPAQPPKLTAWNKNLVSEAPDIYDVKPTVPTSWQYWCGAWGYWLPNALNRQRQYRRGLRSLR